MADRLSVGEARQISTDLMDYSAISIAGDSKSLATVQGTTASNIWTGNLTEAVLPTQLTTGSDQNFHPSWGPDGKIVYSKYCCTNFRDVYIADPRGGSPKQLTTNAGSNQDPVVSPDARSIVFTSDRTGTWCVWRSGIDGGDPLQLTFGSDADPSFSPDGREVVFLRLTNKGSIWKVGIDGGTLVPLTDKESNSPRFSPDGKQVACLYRELPKAPYKIAVMASTGGAPTKTFALPKGYVPAGLRWSPDGRSILFAENRNGVTNIWAQPIDGSSPKQITNFPTGLIDSFDLSPDGKQIAVSRVTSTSDVVLITGFEK
jgi:Tol biopolymer transport system component